MSNFSQNPQNHGFWNFDFWFLFRGKKDNCKLLSIWMQAHHNEKMKELLCVASKFVCNIRQSHSLVEVKMVNYWAEISKLLPRDNIKFCTVHSNYLGCNQITKFTSNFWN